MTGPVIPADARADDIASGWPRPGYLKGGDAKRFRPVQWISNHAQSQIYDCNDNRTFTAGTRFACSCCASVMSAGVLIDGEWAALNRPGGPKLRRDGTVSVDVYDGHYGSPLCVRCALFALTVCPHFVKLDHDHGDALRWVLVTSPADYAEYDESGVLELTEAGAQQARVTTGELRAMSAVGDLRLTGAVLTDEDVQQRPAPYDED